MWRKEYPPTPASAIAMTITRIGFDTAHSISLRTIALITPLATTGPSPTRAGTRGRTDVESPYSLSRDADVSSSRADRSRSAPELTTSSPGRIGPGPPTSGGREDVRGSVPGRM